MRIPHKDSAGASIELTRDELTTLNNALNAVCNGPDAIEDWEFGARIGVTRQEALDLLEEFKKLS